MTHRSSFSCIFTVVLAAFSFFFSVNVAAQQQASTLQLEPLVTHETIAILRVRLQDADPDVWRRYWPGDDTSNEAREDVTSIPAIRVIQVLRAHANRSAYFFFKIGTWEREVTRMAIDVSQGPEDSSDLENAIREVTGFRRFERIGNLLVASREEDAPVSIADSPKRPWLMEALAREPDAAAHLAVSLSETQKQAIDIVAPSLPAQFGTRSLADLTRDVRWMSVSLFAADKFAIKISVEAKDEDAGRRLQHWSQNVVNNAGTKSGDPAATILSQMAVNRNGRRIRLSTADGVRPKVATQTLSHQLAGIVFPLLIDDSIAKARQLSLAIVNYESVYGEFPAAANYNDEGKPLLSWRVHVLPFLEMNDLYQQFRLDESWDSPHNRTLIAKMPEAFLSRASKLTPEEGRSNFIAPTGPRCVMRLKEPQRLRSITDGVSRTITVLEVDAQAAVVWTKPDTIATDLSKKLPVGTMHGNRFVVSFADGHTLTLSHSIDVESLATLIRVDDGKNTDWSLIEKSRVR